MTADEWKQYLQVVNETLFAWPDLTEQTLSPSDPPNGWLGYEPATEAQLEAAEARLGVRLPPSLRNFYTVSNGWRAISCFIWNILPVESIGWLSDADPEFHRTIRDVQCENIPWQDDLTGDRKRDYEYREITCVLRSMLVSSECDAGVCVLDPEESDTNGEWRALHWTAWGEQSNWKPSFEAMIRDDFETFSRLQHQN